MLGALRDHGVVAPLRLEGFTATVRIVPQGPFGPKDMVDVMSDRIDNLLTALRDAGPDRRLDQLEPAVWARIDAKRVDRAPAGSFRMQLAVAAAALVIGLAVGGQTIARPHAPSEAVMLSEDASLTPSMRLEGGA